MLFILRVFLIVALTGLSAVAQNFDSQVSTPVSLEATQSSIGEIVGFGTDVVSSVDDAVHAAREFERLSVPTFPSPTDVRGFFAISNSDGTNTPGFLAATPSYWTGVFNDGSTTWVSLDGKSGEWHRFEEHFIGSSGTGIESGQAMGETHYRFLGTTKPAGVVVSPRPRKEVIWPNLYDGISSSLRYNGDNLERWFTVSPYADATLIRTRLSMASIAEDETGGLSILLKSGAFFQATAPSAFQVSDGRKTSVEISYVLFSTNEFGFQLGEYDQSLPLHIDPVITSTVIGGASADRIRAITADANGDMLATGETSSPLFPITAGAFDPTCSCAGGMGNDLFVSRFSANLQLMNSTFLGGNSTEMALDIDVNGAGEVSICGSTSSTDFPAPVGGSNNPDAFVVRLDSSLSSLLAQGRFGVGAGFNAIGVIKDNVIGGAFGGRAWVASLNSAYTGGTQIIYNPSGMGTDMINDLVVNNGRILAAGSFARQAFLANIAHPVLVAQGGTLTNFGQPGAGRDEYRGATLQPSGTVAVCGSGDGQSLIAVARFDTTGVIQSSGMVDASGSEVANAIAAMADGSLVVTGYTTSNDFPVSLNAISPTPLGAEDAVLVHFNAGVTSLIGSSYMGGTLNDRGHDLLVNSQSLIWVGGETEGSSFPLVSGFGGVPHDLTPNGQADGFLALVEPVLPVISYDSNLNPNLTTLSLSWAPLGGNTNSPFGVLTCSGASPGGLGLFGVSFAPADFLLPFGFPLLVSDAPMFLIDMGGFGFDAFGEIMVNVSRQSPVVAGFLVYLQFYQSFPVIAGSNGLKVLVAP